jgi:hypothetical protein
MNINFFSKTNFTKMNTGQNGYEIVQNINAQMQ